MRWREGGRGAAAPLVVLLALIQFGTTTSAFARAPTVAAGQPFRCTATRVWDGDGPVWCAEGPRLRLAGIAARELDGTCRPGQPCPNASGVEARDRLVQLLGGARGQTDDGHIIVDGPTMACESRGADRYGRTVALCRLAAGDLGRLLVAAGVALPWARFGPD